MDFTLEEDPPIEKGLSQSFDSPNTAKAKKVTSSIDTFAKHASKREGLKLKGSVSERRYIDLGDDELKLDRNCSQPSQSEAQLKFFKMVKESDDIDHGDHKLDSFEDFLKTNNYLDYSMNGIFEESNQANGNKKEISPFDQGNFQMRDMDRFTKDLKLEFSVVAQASHISIKPTPMSILNKFNGAEKVLCGATLNQNFKKSKSNKTKVIDAINRTQGYSNDPKSEAKLFQTQYFGRKENKTPESSIPLDKMSLRSKDKKHIYEKSISSLASGSRMTSINVEEFLKYQDQQNENGYKYVSEEYPDGSKYDGYMLHGKRHGRGTLFLADKSCYSGDWKLNMMSGIGKLTYQDETLAYEGGFLDNKIHGHGVMINREAGMLMPKTLIDFRNFSTVNKWWSTFEGVFNNGIKEGVGTWTFTTGEVFTGNFTNDMVSGVGRFFSGDRVIFGIWFNNIFIKHLY